MKEIAAAVGELSQADISKIETEGQYNLQLGRETVEMLLSDVEIITEDIPGWVVANQGKLTVALDITITENLWQEGIARELVNRIQNIRKDRGFEVTDKITLQIKKNNLIETAISNFNTYICSETLAGSLTVTDHDLQYTDTLELTEDITVELNIDKL